MGMHWAGLHRWSVLARRVNIVGDDKQARLSCRGSMRCHQCFPTVVWQSGLESHLQSSQYCLLAPRRFKSHLPSTKRGTKQCACFSNRPHSLATLIAVKMLSPVTITALMLESSSSFNTGAVLGFSLFSKIMKPTKRRPLSTSSRVIF